MDAVGLTGSVPATIADYQVVRVLGEGNNGRFYLARPPARLGLSDEFVALKVFTGTHSEQAYERGVRELRAFARVSSPYLVKVYDAVLQDSFLYAMEYCPLGSLAAPSRPLSRGEVLRAVGNAASAAHALHEAGLTHGDIKPANILLTEDGGKLSDLGLARYLTPGVTLTGMASAASSLVNQERVNSSLIRLPIILASPSELLSATLPTKPSHTTISVVPLKMSLPSTLP